LQAKAVRFACIFDVEDGMRSLCAAVFALCLPAALAAQTYQCDMKSRGSGGFMPPVVFVGIDRAVGSAAVFDAYINLIYKAPLPVDTRKRSDSLWRLAWTVDNIPTRNAGNAKVRYTALFNIAQGTLTLNGNLVGADNVINGRGTCTQVN